MPGGDDCNSTISGELETEACNTDIVCPGKMIELSILHQRALILLINSKLMFSENTSQTFFS